MGGTSVYIKVGLTSEHIFKSWTKYFLGDFPGGPVAKNLSCNAGDDGWIPCRGTKIPHAAGQLSPHTATTEPTHYN